MKVGLLTTSFPRWEGDVAGSFVLGFARALAGRGHHVEVLAPEPAERVALPTWPGVQLRWLPYMRPRAAARTFYGAGVPDNLQHDLRAWLGLAPFCASMLQGVLQRRRDWDAIVSHFALPCGLIAGALRQSRPHLSVLHSADVHLLTRLPLQRQLAATLAQGATQLLFVSADHRDRFLDRLESSAGARARATDIAHVQPMGIELPMLATDRDRQRSALGLDGFTLLTIGRLVPVKGLLQALQALAHREDLQWLIAGQGPQAVQLAALARRSRLRVRLLGHVSAEPKRALLHAADAFLLPSRILPSGRSEGVPAAALEAMAHGLPLIASDVGGLREVVHHAHTGLLYDPTAPDQLEANIDRLRLNPALRRSLAQQAQEHAQRYAWPQIAERLEALLR